MVIKTSIQENIFGDNIANVECWDFSKANLNEENRINAITQIASVCYQNPKALNSDSLYNRLMAESIGLPSSSFEFVPILLKKEDFNFYKNKAWDKDSLEYTKFQLNIEKFGEWIVHNNTEYLLTNFRAVIYDKETFGIDLTKLFNTQQECDIIKEYFKVFKYKVDLPTRSQMVRHRVNWQELSRRYVSGKRKEFEFYISEKMKNLELDSPFDESTISDVIEICLRAYNTAIDNGIKPEEARRIIPQACYTEIWGAFQPKQLKAFYDLRLDSHAQWEIRKVAEAMKELG